MVWGFSSAHDGDGSDNNENEDDADDDGDSVVGLIRVQHHILGRKEVQVRRVKNYFGS